MRNSPRSFATACRIKEDEADRTVMVAAAMRAPLVSVTSPRSAPLGFWATRLVLSSHATSATEKTGCHSFQVLTEHVLAEIDMRNETFHELRNSL